MGIHADQGSWTAFLPGDDLLRQIRAERGPQPQGLPICPMLTALDSPSHAIVNIACPIAQRDLHPEEGDVIGRFVTQIHDTAKVHGKHPQTSPEAATLPRRERPLE